MRAFTAAALQVRPRPDLLTAATIKDNLDHAAEWLDRCVDASGAELVVLPETMTTGFTPGCGADELWDLVSEIPGPVSEPIQQAAQRLGVHVVMGTYERGPERGVVFNAAVLIDPTGEIRGVYRKTHPFATELRSRGGWVTPGDDTCVIETDLGRIGLIICFDGDYPELSRITALQGAEVICRPSALLRSADIWELTNRARAYDNHVYVIGSNATGVDPAGVIYFGNSMIVTPIAEVVARASSHESWVSAHLDPGERDGLAHTRVLRGPVVRPPRRPQPGAHPPPRRRAPRRGRDPVPAQHAARREHGLMGRVSVARATQGRPSAAAERRIRIGIDTGGTFTDVVAVDEDTGDLVTTKTPSTPADPAIAFMVGVDKVLGLLGVGAEAVTAVSHGTTVATNRLLEGKVDNLGFITNEGYRHLLEIARQSVPDGYGNSYFWVKPPRIVPADLVRTVGGRLAVDGSEIRPLDEAGAVAAARFFRDRGIATIGVCFLHAYANPQHEQRMRAILEREHAEATVSISSDVLREYREYERAVTTLVDAAVKPSIRNYVANIRSRLDSATSRAIPFYVMKSNGGVLSADEVVRQPISTVLSGPAAGALGAARVAQRAGYSRVVTLDGGGTSTDVTVVIDGHPGLTTEGTVGAYPSKIPMIDVVTVGAGGGSIAWISPEGTLKVGPQSAGADPGPLCYRQGGIDPTITDAHVVLGRIPPHLLGGEIPLDIAAARDGIAALAGKLGLGVEEAAVGILEISTWNQANALRQVTVKRGLDVRDFTMVTFGGSGALLACRLVDVLGLDGALVPPNPGNLSAYGLLTVDVRNDYVRTAVSRHRRLELDTVNRVIDDLRSEADTALAREGFTAADRRFLRTADLRYFGQAFEVRVDVPENELTAELVEEVAHRFHAMHRGLYGYDFRGDSRQEVEWVNLRVTGVGPIRAPELREVHRGSGADIAITGRRPVYFDAWVEAAIYDRAKLGAGDVIDGPAVLEEFSSTIPVHPGFRAEVDQFGNVRISRPSSVDHGERHDPGRSRWEGSP